MADAASLPASVLSSILDGSAAALRDAGLAVPERSFVSHEKPDVPLTGNDDDVLAVWVENIHARPIMTRTGGGDLQDVGIHTVLPVRVDLWRCFPGTQDGGGAPDADELTSHTLAALRGAWAIWVGLIHRRDASTLCGPVVGAEIAPRDVGIGSMAVLPVSGYTCGWRISLEVGVPASLEA